MKLINEIFINQYGQGLIGPERVSKIFEPLEAFEKKDFLVSLINLIQQSQPQEEDIIPAIKKSRLKPTYTSCVMLITGGTKTHNLLRLAELPIKELDKTLSLLLSLFREAYYRRFIVEKNSPHKWWYWDLSDEANVEVVLKKRFTP